MGRVYQQEARCPKCGGEDIWVKWCQGYYSPGALVETVCREIVKRDNIKLHEKPPEKALIEGEHMERRCKTCQFSWLERPLDSVSVLEQLAAEGE